MSSKKSDSGSKKDKDSSSEGKPRILRGLGKKIRSAAGFTDDNPYDNDDEVTVVTATGERVTGVKVDEIDDIPVSRGIPVAAPGTTVLQPDGTTITYPPGYSQQLAAQQMVQAQQLAQAQQYAQVQQLAQAQQYAQVQQLAQAQQLAQVQAYNQQVALQNAAVVGGLGVAGMGMGVAGMGVAGMGVAGVPVGGVYPQTVYPYGTTMYPGGYQEAVLYDPHTGKRVYPEETNTVSSVKDLWHSDLM